ncbi:MAG: glycosyltransferase, partial [Chloroflexota bacterium]
MTARSNGNGPRIGLDVAPAQRPLSGVGVYVTELAAALDTLAPDRMVRLGMRVDRALRSTELRAGDSAMRGRLHLVWILRHAERDARAGGCELVHYTNAVAPLVGTRPLVVTIHDLSVIRRPTSHPAARLAVVPFLLSAARRARLIIVPSTATAEEVQGL